MSEQGKTIVQSGKLIIGLTGNIATGKSAVLRLAEEMGALIIDADKIVHHLMDNDVNMQAALAVAFGPEIRRPDGRINRKKLGQIVFQDPVALQDLEQMVHPAVRAAIAAQIQQTDKKIIVIEAIKLLEGELANICHQIWVTRCKKQQQLERLIVCRGMDHETARKRIEAQSPQEEKVARADVVIETDGLLRDTEAQFELFWQRLPDPAEVPPVRLTIPAEVGLLPTSRTAVKPESSAPAKPAAPAAKPATAPSQLTRPIPQSLKAKLGRKIEKPAAQAKETTTEKAAGTVAETAVPTTTPVPITPPARPTTAGKAIEVRRARPSDIPAVLLLIHKATQGAVRLKRADMLLALGERSYFIGQSGTDILAVIGWNIENLVSRVTEIYFHPEDAIPEAGAALLDSIESSADSHICEVIVIFLPPNAPAPLTRLLRERGYAPFPLEKMPATWQAAIQESQPAGSSFVIKVLRERVTHPI